MCVFTYMCYNYNCRNKWHENEGFSRVKKINTVSSIPDHILKSKRLTRDRLLKS